MANNLLVNEGTITRITLNRPERRNALSLDLMRELTAALTSAGGRVIVLGGAGPCFSAGHDLAELVGRDVSFYREVFDTCTVLMNTIQSIEQPVIARVHGVATAAGCQLVASCDLAVAEQGARFATPGVRIGLFCSTPMVPVSRAVGRKRAMEMLLTGEFIDAATAVEWGLINRAVAPDELDAAVDALAGRLLEASAVTVGIGKQAFYQQLDLTQRQAYELTMNVMSLNAMDGDAQEGICAFLDKRPPKWRDG